MKKMVAFVLMLCLSFGLVACGSSTGMSGSAPTQTPMASQPAATPEPAPESSAAPAEPALPEPEGSAKPDDGKTLVVYFSATGNTGTVAGYIADMLQADLFELEPADAYTDADLNYNDENSRVVYEHNNPDEQVVELAAATVENWEQYDTVFIGYPIWWHIAAWPVNGFVTANDFTGKTVIPFCTSGSSDLGESAAILEEMAGTGNWLEGRRFRSSASESDVQAWIAELGL